MSRECTILKILKIDIKYLYSHQKNYLPYVFCFLGKKKKKNQYKKINTTKKLKFQNEI